MQEYMDKKIYLIRQIIVDKKIESLMAEPDDLEVPSPLNYGYTDDFDTSFEPLQFEATWFEEFEAQMESEKDRVTYDPEHHVLVGGYAPLQHNGWCLQGMLSDSRKLTCHVPRLHFYPMIFEIMNAAISIIYDDTPKWIDLFNNICKKSQDEYWVFSPEHNPNKVFLKLKARQDPIAPKLDCPTVNFMATCADPDQAHRSVCEQAVRMVIANHEAFISKCLYKLYYEEHRNVELADFLVKQDLSILYRKN